MFKIGDYIIYGNSGVCKVTEIGNLDLQGINKDKQYYTLQPVYEKGSTVYTPVDNDKVVMRKIIEKEEAMELIDNIIDIPIIWETNDKQRDEVFKESLKKYDCREWISIIKTLYMRKQERLTQGKKITTNDERYLRTAEYYLYGELSIALDIPKDNMEDFIINRLELLEQI